MKTNIYVDGFNLYYGCLKGTSYRWLNIATLCHILLPKADIHRIRYFSALVKDDEKQTKQLTYVRALETISGLTVHYGQYLQSEVFRPLVNPPVNGPRLVKVLKMEEKGSDVNLATYLLIDAFDKDYESAVVISNDSDLTTPIRMVRERFHLPVIVLNPHKKPSVQLRQVATFVKQIRQGPLKASQFPPRLEDTNGTIHKPSDW